MTFITLMIRYVFIQSFTAYSIYLYIHRFDFLQNIDDKTKFVLVEVSNFMRNAHTVAIEIK
jgi:hypothetical protein